MKKRLLSLFICTIMMLSTLGMQIWAEEEKPADFVIADNSATTIISTEYSDIATSSVTSAKSGLFNNASLIHYEVDIKKAGKYTVDLTGKPYNYAYMTVAMQLDDSLLCTVSIYENAGAYQTVTSRILDLPEGRHKFSLVIKGNMHAYISQFVFKPYTPKELVSNKDGAYKESWIPTVIQAEDFDYDSKAVNPDNRSEKYRKDVAFDIYASGTSGYFVSLKKGEYLKYTFNADVQDAYRFSAKVSGGEGALVYFDENVMPLKIYPDDAESPTIGIYLSAGVHTMRVEPAGENVDVDYFRFKSGADEYTKTDNLGSKVLKAADEKETHHPVYKEFYVADSGTDSGDGSKENPFRTIGRAKEEVKKYSADMTGDIIVNVKSGYYEIPESIKFGTEDSGKNGFDIIYRGEDRDNPPLLSGGKKVSDWQKYDDYLWRAPVPSDVEHVRNLYVNNYPAVRARSKYFYKYEETYDDPNTVYKKDGMWVPYKNFPKNLTNHDDIELVWELDWTSQYTLVEEITYDHEKETVLFKMDPYSFNTNTLLPATMPAPGKVFAMENAFELLDEKGEFYYNKKDGYIYYYPHDEENMETAEVYVGKSQQMIMIEGNSVKDRVENIKFDNFEIRYGAWDRASEYGFFTIQADQVITEYTDNGRSTIMLPAQITVQRAENIDITNCSLSCLGSSAISVPDAATNVRIEGNLIKDVSGSGISVGSWLHATEGEGREIVKNITVKNNVVHRPGGEYRDAMGIVVYYASHVDVVHNDIYYTPYTGMSIGWGWGTTDPPGYGYFTVNNNKVDSTMTSLLDGAPVYLLGPMRGTEIGYNFLTNASFNQTIGGVYFDAGTRFVRSHHNLVTSSPSWFMWSGWHGIIDVRVDSYYATTDKVAGPGDVKSIDLEFPTVIDADESKWPTEAKEIKANAGVEDEYKEYLGIAHFPDWKKERLRDYADKKLYSTQKDGNWIEAEDFMGGEGIGWYKIEPLYDSNTYRPTEGVSLYESISFGSLVIDRNFDGEWLKYEFDVEEAGEYYFDLSYGHGYGDTDAASKTTIWIDDEILTQDMKLPGDSWSKLREIQLGKKHLEPGKHTFKIMVQVNGFYIDAWRFHDGREYEKKEFDGYLGNELGYDEGVIK